MTDNKIKLNEIRQEAHIADAECRFLLHLTGNEISKKFGYGDLSGLDAVARYIQERDGIPMYETVASSTELLSNQLAGVDVGKDKYNIDDLSEPDKATRGLMIANAKNGALLEQFGDQLGEREGLDETGLDAVRLYISEKFGLEITKLESLHSNELRKYLSKEMKGWTISGWRKPTKD